MKQSLSSELLNNEYIKPEISSLVFNWKGQAPRAGQFFMIKPKRSSVFLARPVSAAGAPEAGAVRFLIARRGAGTVELVGMRPGEEANLTGPLGNAWADFVSAGEKPLALVGGGIGIAPLVAFAGELAKGSFDFYAGFRNGFCNVEEKSLLFGPALSRPAELLIATEDGTEGFKGRIPDFLEASRYRAVFACGPSPMLKAVAARCKEARVPCFVSLERRMACGTGACLGCTVNTVNGNRRCCADGPVFNAEELFFDE